MLERIGKALKVEELPSTVFETTIAWVCARQELIDMEKAGVKVGAWSDAFNTYGAMRHPTRYLKKTCIEAPIDEEIEHRWYTLIPVINESNVVNLAMTARFAMVHNRTFDGTMDFSRIPYGQFIAGLHLSSVAKRRNILHAMIAHSTWNVLCFGSIKLEQATEITKEKLNKYESYFK